MHGLETQRTKRLLNFTKTGRATVRPQHLLGYCCQDGLNGSTPYKFRRRDGHEDHYATGALRLPGTSRTKWHDRQGRPSRSQPQRYGTEGETLALATLACFGTIPP